MAIARRPVIGLARWSHMRVGRQLHHAEGRDRAGESMAFAAGADEGIDGVDRIGCGLLGGEGGAGEQAGRDGQAGEADQHGLRLNHACGDAPSA